MGKITSRRVVLSEQFRMSTQPYKLDEIICLVKPNQQSVIFYMAFHMATVFSRLTCVAYNALEDLPRFLIYRQPHIVFSMFQACPPISLQIFLEFA